MGDEAGRPLWLRLEGSLREWIEKKAKDAGVTKSEFIRYTLMIAKEKEESDDA